MIISYRLLIVLFIFFLFWITNSIGYRISRSRQKSLKTISEKNYKNNADYNYHSLPLSSSPFYDLNPDIFRTTPELLESRGFQSETHTVTTDDGYILTIFRIIDPYYSERSKSLNLSSSQPRPLILWHGIGVSSDSWLYSTDGHMDSNGIYMEHIGGEHSLTILNDCNDSVTNTLGFTLASCGYDVWLPNSRGGHYSNGHIRFNSTIDKEYWQYTLTELAIYDVPAVISYVLRTTGKKSLAYVGHSLGTDQMFALQSLIPQYGNLVKPFIALAPVAYLGHMWSSARLFLPLQPLARAISIPVGAPVFLMQLTGSLICGNDFLVGICTNMLYSINGRDSENYNQSVTPIDVAHSFVPSSSWLLAHLGQMALNDRYQMMDFGPERNQVLYGREDAPDYPLADIQSPNIALFRGQNDALADVDDVEHLVRSLKVTLLDNYIIPNDNWNHQDFQLAFTQGFYVNKRLLSLLKMFDHD